MKDADILIKNGIIVTMDNELKVFDKADIAIKDSKIIEVSSSSKLKAIKTIDASGKVVMPGLVNGHTHAAMTMLRGIADDMPLDTWWSKIMFPLEQKFAGSEFIKTGVALAAVEMIKTGTTSFVDMYFFEDNAAEVCKKIGIRAFLGEGLLDFETPSCKTPDDSIKYIETLNSKWKGDPIIHPVVAPHAPYTCGPEVLKKSKALADKLDIPLHIHLAETLTEVATIKEKYGTTPTGRLEKEGFLSERVSAAHCVHLTEEDIEILKKREVKTVDCPESNMKLASGISPVADLLKAGITVALGTDGAASNNNLNMFEEMDVAAKLDKLKKLDPTSINAKEVVKMGTKNGARSVLRDDLGIIEAGKTADIIILDFKRPHLTPLYNVYSHLAYSVTGDEVETVIINGRIVMENKKILTIDEQEVMEAANRFAEKIKKEVEKLK